MLRKWRLGAGLVSVIGLVLTMVGAGVLVATATQPPDHKVTICHRNDNDKDPYVVETVDIASSGYLQAGHNDHTGPIWAPGMKAEHDKWGDIIPPYTYTKDDGSVFTYDGLNWSSRGEAIYDNGCKIPLTPTQTTTTVFDASTNAAWSGTEQELAAAYDTAVVAHSSAIPVATGTVTYTFFTNNTCSGNGVSAGTKTLDTLGRVPKSSTQSDLAAGFYAFKASYSGDSVYAGSTSACEPFTVKSPPGGPKITTTTTTVFNASTNAAWAAPVFAPASAYDTAKVVTPSVLPAPTGTVTYTFFTNNACTEGTGTSAGTKTIGVMGNVPNSDTKSNLAAGNYAFMASYSGDSNYKASTSVCEPFTVSKEEGGLPGTSSITTAVFDNATGKAVTGLEKAGVTVYDTSKVTIATGTPKGTVSYTFFTNNSCTGTGTAAGTVTLDASGNAPISNKQASLNQGLYSFKATFTPANAQDYSGSTSACEPFDVDPGGAVLAATGMTTPTQSMALALMAFGLIAMTAAFVSWRRREA